MFGTSSRTQEGWKRRGISLCLVAAFALSFAFSGCLGPTALSVTRTRYNEVYRSTNDEQLLLNIVRLRYADSPIFMDLSNITSQFEMSGRGNYSYGLDGSGPGMSNLGLGEWFIRDAPTFSYHPRTGQETAKSLLQPLSAELFSVVNAGANFQQFMLMAVNDINDVPNAARSIAMIPNGPDDNFEFRRGVQLLGDLEQRGAIELTVRKLEDSDDISDPIAMERIGGADLVNAAKENYVFRTVDQDRMTVHKYEKTLVLRVREQDRMSPEMLEVAQIFRLRPGRSTYKIKSEMSGDHPEREPGIVDEEDLAAGDTIFVNMRSMLQIGVFLSKGVCIPDEHVTRGIAPMTADGSGQLYDWTNVTQGLFQVCSSKRRPKKSEIAVKYRGYWFYIAPNDVQSRASMAIYEILFAVQESDVRSGGPLLTLPLGG
ncbi:hypothetical protein [Schlesneria sp.]|uniref:hypothetical protein n=1 Tax=Schlesneria sp. TaxID=2762018 RepID=UPI002EFD52CF